MMKKSDRETLSFEHENLVQFAATFGHALRSSLCLVNGFVEDCVSGEEVMEEDAEFSDKALKNIFFHLNQISKYQGFFREAVTVDVQKMVDSLRSDFSEKFLFEGSITTRVSSLLIPIIASLFFYFDGHLQGGVQKKLVIREGENGIEFQVVGNSTEAVKEDILQVKELSELIKTDKTWFGLSLIFLKHLLEKLDARNAYFELTNAQIKTTFFIPREKSSF